MTLQVEVGEAAAARRFYGAIFGSGPDYEPHEDFLEWRVGDGETWLQATVPLRAPRPLLNRVRFRVGDLAAARQAVLDGVGDPSAIRTLPGVASFFDFDDPWGNHLGYFQDLAPGGQPPVPGGSVHDETQFR
jgi:hypothetical protein